jgi:hypothetical protein
LRRIRERPFVYALIGVGIVLIALSFFRRSDNLTQITIDDVYAAADQGRLTHVNVDGTKLTVRLAADDTVYETHVDDGVDAQALLVQHGVRFGDGTAGTVTLSHGSGLSWWSYAEVAALALPILGVIVFLRRVVFLRRSP